MNTVFNVRHDLRPSGLEGISEAEIAHHWSLYEGYVRHLNALNGKISRLSERGDFGDEFLELKRREVYAYNPVILHEHYFGILGAGHHPPRSEAELMRELNKCFGGFDAWRREFAALGALRGAGWVILHLDPVHHSLSNHWISMQEEGHPAGLVPLLAMDTWDHAYALDRIRGGLRGYVDCFLANVNWDRVERHLEHGQRLEPDIPEGVAFAAE